MDATRDDLVQFISALRSELHGPSGAVGDPVQTETLAQLKRQVVGLVSAKRNLQTQVESLNDLVCQGRSKIRPRWRRKTRPAAAARRSC